MSRHGLGIAGPNEASARAGAALAEAGGNAVDAALAAMLAALVSEPGIASLGGGGFVTIAVPGQPVVTVDGGVAVPGLEAPAGRHRVEGARAGTHRVARAGAGTHRVEGVEAGRRDVEGAGAPRGRAVTAGEMEELHLEYGGGVDFGVGHASVAVPGTLVALETAHRRSGRAPWAEVVAPAAELARTGFRIGTAAGHYLGYSGEVLFGRDPAARAVLSDADGHLFGAGATMRMPDLADFLDRVALEGSAALHHGDVAKALVAEMAEHGGLLTLADLEQYRALVRPALVSRSGGWEWATNPPPAVGGAVLTSMLLLADDLTAAHAADLTAANASHPPTAARTRPGAGEIIALQRAVLSYRVRRLDLAPSTHARIAAAEDMLAAITATGTGWLSSAPSTVHVSAVDADGVACAVTASSGYGSGVSAPGTGIWLNNCLGERELNRLGPGALPPGDRVVSNMTPTIGRHDDGRVLAIGSPGSDRITTALLQVILSLQVGDSLDVAIGRPRLHVSCDPTGRPVRVEYERELAAELAAQPAQAASQPGTGATQPGTAAAHPGAAHPGTGAAQLGPGTAFGDLELREHPSRAMFFGGVAAALRAPDGTLEAAADPRREGGVRVLGR